MQKLKKLKENVILSVLIFVSFFITTWVYDITHPPNWDEILYYDNEPRQRPDLPLYTEVLEGSTYSRSYPKCYADENQLEEKYEVVEEDPDSDTRRTRYTSGVLVQDKDFGQHLIARPVYTTTSLALPRIFQDSHNLMRLADLGCNGTRLTSIWELCTGIPLKKRIAMSVENCHKHALSVEQVKSIMRTLVGSVQYFLTKGIRHRDLTLETIMYDEEKDLNDQKDQVGTCIVRYSKTEMTTLLEIMGLSRNIITAEQEAFTRISYDDDDGPVGIYKDDILALGATLAQLLHIPDRLSATNPWQLQQLIQLLGRSDFEKHAATYNVELDDEDVLAALESAPHDRTDWYKYRNECNRHLLTKDAVSFLDGLLQYSYSARLRFILKAHEHPFIYQVTEE